MTAPSPQCGEFSQLSNGAAQDLLSALSLSNACIREFDGTIRFWSQGNEHMYGWSAQEAVGQSTHVLFQTEFPIPLYEIEIELLQKGSWKGELRHRTRRGTTLWVATSWVLQRDGDGSPRSVIEVNNDITDRKHAEETSRYLAALVQSSEDAIIAKTLDGLVTSWNVGAEHLFGYSEAEMLGKSILKLFPPELIHEELRILSRVARGERIRHYETTRIKKTGERVPVSLSISPILDRHGRVIGASKIARDISERRLLEQAVYLTEQRQHLAVEAGEIGLWTYHLVSHELIWTDRCKKILGLSPDAQAPSYKQIRSLIHPQDLRPVLGAFRSCVVDGALFDVDFRLTDKDGQIHWVHCKGRPVPDEAGRVTEVHGTLLDFTNRKLVEQQLMRTNSQLQQFAYAAAHDLQEPLRNVALSIQLAKLQIRDQLEPEADLLLRNAVENAHQLEALVRDLLAYSKVLHEMDECAREIVDAQEVMKRALDNLSTAIAETAANVRVDTLPRVRIGHTHLLELFQNLIGNALKHRGPEPPAIFVSARTKNGHCEFSIQDNGIGIEPQFHQRVFDVFKRLRKKDTPGTGVGLALCKRIVERYGGNIWISSDGRNGTTLFFTVPCADVN